MDSVLESFHCRLKECDGVVVIVVVVDMAREPTRDTAKLLDKWGGFQLLPTEPFLLQCSVTTNDSESAIASGVGIYFSAHGCRVPGAALQGWKMAGRFAGALAPGGSTYTSPMPLPVAEALRTSLFTAAWSCTASHR